jgi:hypothetical protein
MSIIEVIKDINPLPKELTNAMESDGWVNSVIEVSKESGISLKEAHWLLVKLFNEKGLRVPITTYDSFKVVKGLQKHK